MLFNGELERYRRFELSGAENGFHEPNVAIEEAKGAATNLEHRTK
jgi:hypothetical protein